VNGDLLTSRSLLVIDPDRSVHDVLRNILQREDRTIQDAFGGAEAEALLRTAPFDVVLAGQGSNGSDGLKMVRRIRALQPDTRVILTGEPDPDRVIRAIRARVFSYCHNPPPPGPLSDIVQQALDASSWLNDILVLSARPEWITLDVRCKMEAGDRATYFFREIEAGLPTTVCEDVTSAFRELLFNAMEHGGKYNPRKRVRVEIQRARKALIVHIQDPGRGFSLDSLPHAAISNPAGSPSITWKSALRPASVPAVLASS
jgi:CheY-like chemotaxis protein